MTDEFQTFQMFWTYNSYLSNEFHAPKERVCLTISPLNKYTMLENALYVSLFTFTNTLTFT